MLLTAATAFAHAPEATHALCQFVWLKDDLKTEEIALREAKRTTNWVEPDEAHEAAVQAWCAALYEHEAFLAAAPNASQPHLPMPGGHEAITSR